MMGRFSEAVREVDAGSTRYQTEMQQELNWEERKAIMSEMNSVVAVYGTHSQAEEAVKELQRSGLI